MRCCESMGGVFSTRVCFSGRECTASDAVPTRPALRPYQGSSSGSLRVLCLHGHNSNSDITSIQITGLNLSKHCRCMMAHGQWPGEDSGLSTFSDGPWHTWARRGSTTYWNVNDWEGSLQYVADLITEHGPFDGVYAFSQRAALVTELTAPEIWRDKLRLEQCPWKFAILACAGAHDLVSSADVLLQIPSLHIKGAQDVLCQNDSAAIEAMWEPSKRYTYTHSGGHQIKMSLVVVEPELATLLDTFLAGQTH